MLAAFHHHIFAWVNGVDGRALGLVVVELLRCGFGVDEPHGAVLFDGGINGGLPCCFRHGEDVCCVLMVVDALACESIGNVVKVDADVTWLCMLGHIGGLASGRGPVTTVSATGTSLVCWCLTPVVSRWPRLGVDSGTLVWTDGRQAVRLVRPLAG